MMSSMTTETWRSAFVSRLDFGVWAAWWGVGDRSWPDESGKVTDWWQWRGRPGSPWMRFARGACVDVGTPWYGVARDCMQVNVFVGWWCVCASLMQTTQAVNIAQATIEEVSSERYTLTATVHKWEPAVYLHVRKHGVSYQKSMFVQGLLNVYPTATKYRRRLAIWSNLQDIWGPSYSGRLMRAAPGQSELFSLFYTLNYYDPAQPLMQLLLKVKKS